MRKLDLLIVFLVVLNIFLSKNVVSQDYIVNKGNDTLYCKILEVDSVWLYYEPINSSDNELRLMSHSRYKKYYVETETILNSFNVQENCNISRKKGGYLSFEEFKNNSPSVIFDFEMIKRSKFDYAMSGGNDYKFKSLDKKIDKQFIKKDLWAISNGKDCYINCKRTLKQKDYSLLHICKDYAHFKAPLPSLNQNSAYMFGAVGGAAGASAALDKAGYKVDMISGKILK